VRRPPIQIDLATHPALLVSNKKRVSIRDSPRTRKDAVY
jgi:hypothetical protein